MKGPRATHPEDFRRLIKGAAVRAGRERATVGLARLFGLSSRSGEALSHRASRAVRKVVSLCHSLLSERGEIAGGRLAAEAIQGYQALEPADRRVFFELLVKEFSSDPDEVIHAADIYRRQPSPENLGYLQHAVESPRQELFRRLNLAPGGTHALIEMRHQLLRELNHGSRLDPIAADLGHLLTSWFNRGFLVLQRIDWHTSAIILEKLIEYEAVHQIQGWHDLRRRLEADRRCYAFFHPALPNEPIIFIEVALTRGVSDKVQPLLDPDAPVLDPESADCAMFYSITNCQEGLRGVPFGSFLIKRVVEDLSRKFPRLKRFATVSPVPGFRRWLAEKASARDGNLLTKLEDPKWFENEKLAAELQKVLVPLCARYLLEEKQGKEPLDPVARFHLKNGARLEQINWLGDTSAIGMERSAGLMANYVYRLGDVERNHELYTQDFKIAAAKEVQALAKQSHSVVKFPSSR
jgi:malonyl-CoA decarboxylase